jgi:sarcosine oxidase subunit gamma
MPETIRQSPLHDLLQTAPPPGGAVQAERLQRVGLCDVSLLEKLGLKGPGAATWLGDQGLAVLAEVYASGPLEAGGLVVRLGVDEFLLEAGSLDRSLTPLRDALPVDSAQLVPVVREDATLLLCGPRALDLLAQCCAHDFSKSPSARLVYTRIAGVSCGILPQQVGGNPVYRIWFDPSYAIYLWETLVGIADGLGGGAVDAGAIFAESR